MTFPVIPGIKLVVEHRTDGMYIRATWKTSDFSYAGNQPLITEITRGPYWDSQIAEEHAYALMLTIDGTFTVEKE